MSKYYGEVRLGVVLGLLALIILGAALILFPPFVGHDGSRWPSSMSNIKQIGLAEMQYTQDYNERLPARQYSVGPSTYSWRMALQPYIKTSTGPKNRDGDIFAAPDNAAGDLPDIENDTCPRSYAVNSTTSASTAGPFSDTFAGNLALTELVAPASTICFVESTSAYNDFSVLEPAQFTSPTSKRYAPGHLFARKLGSGTMSTTVGYADGHTKSVLPMSTLGSANQPGQWGIENGPMSPTELTTATTVIAYGIAHSDADRRIPPRARTFWQNLTGATR